MMTAPFRHLGILPSLLVSLATVLTGTGASSFAASADLWQARNGPYYSPTTPVQWAKGNAGPDNSHFIEGHSIPYRMVMTGLTNGPHTLVVEWDTKQKGKHAIDYVTHYNRLTPHHQFSSHTTAEVINPLDGIAGSFGTASQFPIPAPSTLGSPVPGQPAASFQAVPESERVMTIWNGTITRLVYVTEETLAADTAVTRLSIDFVAADRTVVVAWGGHIASPLDWGSGHSATSIEGSPYHMRKIDLDGSGGNQDRSLQALAVLSPPTCTVAGPPSVCSATVNTYTLITDANDVATTYQWSLADNTSGAIILGATNGPLVEVMAGAAGAYVLQAVVTAGGSKSSCANQVTVLPSTIVPELADQTICPGSGVAFSAVPAGTAPFAFIWSKDGQPIPGATDGSLLLENVTVLDAGEYCVEVTGACGIVSRCARLTVEPPPVLVGPPDLTRECFADFPPPDPASVLVIGGAGLVSVAHVGDVAETNDCEILVLRTYQVTDSCSSQASWHQIITVLDTKPPVLAALPDRSVECGLPWNFETPGVTDQCDGTNVTLIILETVTNGFCGSTYTATRVWQATDRCGNNATVSQTITVQDTTPPVITCAPGRNVQCGVSWDFDSPTATDICDGSDVVITVTGTITNALPGNLLESTRSWMATDACGNAATCSQTITVVDTTAPEIVCATNAVVPCTGPEGAAVSFEVTATDVCDANVQVLCVPVSGSVFPLGSALVQCVATDVNGNASQCSFTVTVIDTVPPLIACPAGFAVLEDPPGSGQAAVSFAAPSASDNCDLHPAIVCSPLSGSILPVGDTVVLCVATDASGNTNGCSFQIRVVPQVIMASSLEDSGPGTLRQALLDANAAPGSNAVSFAFTGSTPFVIHLLSPLPAIADPLLIDGWSQLEFRGQPVIELDGSNAVASGAPAGGLGFVAAGLDVVAGGSEVRGLSLNGFQVGLRVGGPGGNIIQGNFIGTDPDGASSTGNIGDGVQIYSAGNLIGGDKPAARNVISGNRGHGIVLDGSNAVGNVVRGNWIGLGADGSSPLGNGLDGIAVRNGAAGNRLGPDNVIAFNGLNGVLLEPTAGDGNAVRSNAIFGNGTLGIDLGGDGATANDGTDADSGPNQLQNFPMITAALTSGDTTTVAGTLEGASNSVLQIDFFLTSEIDPQGSGQRQRYLGSATVVVDATGRGDFSVALPQPVPAGQFITATATDAGDNTSEFSPAVQVGGPPVIVTHPAGTAVTPGTPVMFCVTAIGSQPLVYQWRRNGANIPGATNTCITIKSAEVMDGGSYTVIVANDLGVAFSNPAVLRLILPPVQVADNFVDRVPLEGAVGLVAWNNNNATRESGEPIHAGKPGGKSIWYTWTAPATGIATLSAIGSAFDTLLGVYVGGSVSNLTVVESDEDRGGFFTSIVRFNAFTGTQYQIAIDGYGGESGEFVFSWQFEATTRLLPVIFEPPVSQTAAAGSTVTFSVDASVDCREPHYNCRRVTKDQPPEHPSDRDPLAYQWYLNGVAIPGATKSFWTVTNVQAGVVGIYTVRVSGNNETVETQPVTLQINETGSNVQNVQARDKFLDAATAPPLRLGTSSVRFTASADSGGPVFAAAAIVRSYTSTQVFSSAGGTTSAGELPPCYGMGGASEWFAVVTEEAGVLHVNTDGSSYDTVLGVYTYSPTSQGLALLGCDNNSGVDRRDSAVSVQVQAGQTNFVVIDGYNGASGVASLHCTLVTPGSLEPIGFTALRALRLRLTGQPAMHFMLQASSNLVSWVPLITNTSASGTFDFTDTRSTNAPRRFYRALMLP
jgi:hypothetical protein